MRGINTGPNRGAPIFLPRFITGITLTTTPISPKQAYLKTFYFGLCFCAIFTGYYVTTSFNSIIYPDTAFIGFLLLYLFYGIGSLLGPSVAKRLGLRTTTVVMSLGYIFYIGSVNSQIIPLYLIASCVCGFCAGCIWLNQGIWISRISEFSGNGEQIGRLSGIFYAIFNLNSIIGNIIGIVLTLYNISRETVIWVMMGISSLGFLMSIFVAPLKSSNPSESKSQEDENSSNTFVGRIKEVVDVRKEKLFLLLIPLIVLQSCSIVISYQILPVSIALSLDKLLHYYSFLAYGVGAMLFSFLWGKLYDKDWKFVLFPLILSIIVELVLFVILNSLQISKWVWILVGFLCGVNDYGINSLLTSTIISKFSDKSTPMFAFYRLLYCASYVPISIISGKLPYYVLLSVTGGMLLLSSLCYLYFIFSFRDLINL